MRIGGSIFNDAPKAREVLVKVVTNAGQKPFIEVPLIAGPQTTATQLVGRLLPEFTTPLANRLEGDDDSAFQ